MSDSAKIQFSADNSQLKSTIANNVQLLKDYTSFVESEMAKVRASFAAAAASYSSLQAAFIQGGGMPGGRPGQPGTAAGGGSGFGAQAAHGFGVVRQALGFIGVGIGLNEVRRQAMDSIQAFSELETLDVRLAQALKNHGAAAKITAADMDELVVKTGQMSRFNQEAVKSSGMMLLQLGMTGDEIREIIPLAADLAESMGGDLPQASRVLALALQNPERAWRLLRSANIAFTEEQRESIKEMVKAGDTAKAQALIMEQVRKSVGGMAGTAANTVAGHVDQLSDSIRELRQAIGEWMAGPLKEFLDGLKAVVDTITPGKKSPSTVNQTKAEESVADAKSMGDENTNAEMVERAKQLRRELRTIDAELGTLQSRWNEADRETGSFWDKINPTSNKFVMIGAAMRRSTIEKDMESMRATRERVLAAIKELDEKLYQRGILEVNSTSYDPTEGTVKRESAFAREFEESLALIEKWKSAVSSMGDSGKNAFDLIAGSVERVFDVLRGGVEGGLMDKFKKDVEKLIAANESPDEKYNRQMALLDAEEKRIRGRNTKEGQEKWDKDREEARKAAVEKYLRSHGYDIIPGSATIYRDGSVKASFRTKDGNTQTAVWGSSNLIDERIAQSDAEFERTHGVRPDVLPDDDPRLKPIHAARQRLIDERAREVSQFMQQFETPLQERERRLKELDEMSARLTPEQIAAARRGIEEQYQKSIKRGDTKQQATSGLEDMMSLHARITAAAATPFHRDENEKIIDAVKDVGGQQVAAMAKVEKNTAEANELLRRQAIGMVA